MNFNEILNKYIDELNCTSKTLSNVSGISNSVISRYRNGQRVPSCDSTQVVSIANAIEKISNGKYNGKEVLKQFNDCINQKDSFDYSSFSKNLKEISECLHINTNDMAKYIIFDPSHISRIKAGKTRPSDPIDFTKKVSSYIVYKYNDNISKKELSLLLKCNVDDLNEKINFFNLVFKWLSKSTEENKDNKIEKFLNNMDAFDLNDYIKAIKFDDLKIPFVPFYHIKNKNYYGLEEMKKAEIDFFKAAVLSKNKSDIYMMSDMKMEDMASDIEFGKKWMLGIAFCLKKGIHINIIHNLDRPFKEMILGLESWIPLYMTGLITPFYLKDYKDNVFEHLNYFKYPISLTGEAIKGHHEKGKYYLTTNLKEINYYQEKTNNLFKKALPLMEIYNNSSTNSFKSFLNNSLNIKEKRERYLTSLPIFTIENNLLLSILKRNNLSDEEINKILEYKKEEENNINLILENNIIIDNCYEFDNSYLALENIFYEKKIYYTKTEFSKHLKSTKEYAKKNKNYFLNISNNKVFKNINITILTNNYVIVSKSNNPVIHFVIKHEKLMNAIINFYPIVKE